VYFVLTQLIKAFVTIKILCSKDTTFNTTVVFEFNLRVMVNGRVKQTKRKNYILYTISHRTVICAPDFPQ